MSLLSKFFQRFSKLEFQPNSGFPFFHSSPPKGANGMEKDPPPEKFHHRNRALPALTAFSISARCLAIDAWINAVKGEDNGNELAT
jgi:hypothetical protein